MRYFVFLDIDLYTNLQKPAGWKLCALLFPLQGALNRVNNRVPMSYFSRIIKKEIENNNRGRWCRSVTLFMGGEDL